jgi:hypothetical protein
MISEAQAGLNAHLRARLGGPQPQPQAAPAPDALVEALEASRAALASGDAEAIVQTDDKLATAVEQAGQPPKRQGRRDWGQGARGTRSSSPITMDDQLRAASMPNLHPAHGRPGPDGRIR